VYVNIEQRLEIISRHSYFKIWRKRSEEIRDSRSLKRSLKRSRRNEMRMKRYGAPISWGRTGSDIARDVRDFVDNESGNIVRLTELRDLSVQWMAGYGETIYSTLIWSGV